MAVHETCRDIGTAQCEVCPDTSLLDVVYLHVVSFAPGRCLVDYARVCYSNFAGYKIVGAFYRSVRVLTHTNYLLVVAARFQTSTPGRSAGQTYRF